MFQDDLQAGLALIDKNSPEAIRKRDRARQVFSYSSQVRNVAPNWDGTVSGIPSFLTHSASALGLTDPMVAEHLKLAQQVAKLRAIGIDRQARLAAVDTARATLAEAQRVLDEATASAAAITEKQAMKADAQAQAIEDANAELFKAVCPDE